MSLIVLLTSTGGAWAWHPTESDIEPYRDYLEGHGFLARTSEEYCIAERLCAAGGPIGSRTGCIDATALCLDHLVKGTTPQEERWRRDCPEFLAQFTSSQYSELAAPKGCGTPPPAMALAPAFTGVEVQCLLKVLCHPISDFTRQMSCEENLRPCTSGLEKMSPTGRASCRRQRTMVVGFGFLTAEGPCQPELGPPFLAAVDQKTLPAVTDWRTQVEGTARPPKDKFDLGDLDF